MSDDSNALATTKAMRNLSDADRQDAIATAPNVIGFERFQQQAKQVALRDAYRKPGEPA